MLFHKKYILNLLLAVVAVGLATALYQSWNREIPPLPAPELQVEDKNLEKQENYVRILPVKDSYRAVTERNLFSPERKEFIVEKPIVEEKPVVQKIATISGRAIKLFGIIQLGNQKKALITDPQQTGKRNNKWVSVGDQIGNLRVVAISADKLQVIDGNERYDIMLHDEKRKSQGSLPAAKVEPTVISTGPANPPSASAPPSADQPSSDEFVTINTPFGPIKRRKN
ncbi:MAG: hypothetical protein KKB30_06480 [Proteobacteria bacterium]|nr:hypothetical protein [Pseudomonadota bacterium]MBU1715166.1 hypothetical protein [Pseudomonadota bacterium]